MLMGWASKMEVLFADGCYLRKIPHGAPGPPSHRPHLGGGGVTHIREVGGASGVGLDVDGPLLRVQPEGGEGPRLAEVLHLVHDRVAPVEPRPALPWETGEDRKWPNISRGLNDTKKASVGIQSDQCLPSREDRGVENQYFRGENWGPKVKKQTSPPGRCWITGGGH